MNLGCPFPPQIKRGRGAALLVNPNTLEAVLRIMEMKTSIKFSLKMRIGLSKADDWRKSIGVINDMPLRHITVHLRVAAQNYDGPLDIPQFERILAESKHPVVYNGDISSAEEIDAVIRRFPEIAGVMVGRGLLRTPYIVEEWLGKRVPEGGRLECLLKLHHPIYAYWQETLCGESQILSKIKPFWDYTKPDLPHKVYKAIKKATTLSKYEMAVLSLG